MSVSQQEKRNSNLMFPSGSSKLKVIFGVSEILFLFSSVRYGRESAPTLYLFRPLFLFISRTKLLFWFYVVSTSWDLNLMIQKCTKELNFEPLAPI